MSVSSSPPAPAILNAIVPIALKLAPPKASAINPNTTEITNIREVVIAREARPPAPIELVIMEVAAPRVEAQNIHMKVTTASPTAAFTTPISRNERIQLSGVTEPAGEISSPEYGLENAT